MEYTLYGQSPKQDSEEKVLLCKTFSSIFKLIRLLQNLPYSFRGKRFSSCKTLLPRKPASTLLSHCNGALHQLPWQYSIVRRQKFCSATLLPTKENSNFRGMSHILIRCIYYEQRTQPCTFAFGNFWQHALNSFRGKSFALQKLFPLKLFLSYNLLSPGSLVTVESLYHYKVPLLQNRA